MEIRVPHDLPTAEVAARLRALAERHGVELHPEPGGARGRLERAVPPLGVVEATYAIEPAALVVRVERRPAFLPEGLVRRQLEDEVAEALR